MKCSYCGETDHERHCVDCGRPSVDRLCSECWSEMVDAAQLDDDSVPTDPKIPTTPLTREAWERMVREKMAAYPDNIKATWTIGAGLIPPRYVDDADYAEDHF